MNVFHLPITSSEPLPPCVATIGFFDGVHRGHRFLLSQVKEVAEEQGMVAAAITFDNHPKTVVTADGYTPELLTTTRQKLNLLEETAIGETIVMHFDREMAAMSARQFMSDVLKRQINVSTLVIGYDHRFGHGSDETFSDYQRYGREIGINVVQAQAMNTGGEPVSSSRIRRLLTSGDTLGAADCLGRPYELVGTVTTGYRIGRTIGFPTANLSVEGMLVPKVGVYVADVTIDNDPLPHRAMLNIGTRPTFDGDRLSIEVHLIDFSGDLYRHTLHVAFGRLLRPERRFSSAEALAQQLEKDRQTVLSMNSIMRQ